MEEATAEEGMGEEVGEATAEEDTEEVGEATAEEDTEEVV